MLAATLEASFASGAGRRRADRRWTKLGPDLEPGSRASRFAPNLSADFLPMRAQPLIQSLLRSMPCALPCVQTRSRPDPNLRPGRPAGSGAQTLGPALVRQVLRQTLGADVAPMGVQSATPVWTLCCTCSAKPWCNSRASCVRAWSWEHLLVRVCLVCFAGPGWVRPVWLGCPGQLGWSGWGAWAALVCLAGCVGWPVLVVLVVGGSVGLARRSSLGRLGEAGGVRRGRAGLAVGVEGSVRLAAGRPWRGCRGKAGQGVCVGLCWLAWFGRPGGGGSVGSARRSSLGCVGEAGRVGGLGGWGGRVGPFGGPVVLGRAVAAKLERGSGLAGLAGLRGWGWAGRAPSLERFPRGLPGGMVRSTSRA